MTIISGIKQYIFEENSPSPSCHASTLTYLSNGEILAAWFGGTCEGDPDVDIWLSRCNRGTWSHPIKIAEEQGLPHWNPVLFAKDDGRVYLFYKVGRTFSEWYTRVMISENNGQTWSQAKELVQGDRGGRGPVRNKPIILQSGVWAAPASLESEIWDAFVDLFSDQSETWTRSEMVPFDHESSLGKGIIQPTLWESEEDQVHMLLRSTEGFVYRSDSCDGGENWCQAYPTSLPNNNSGIDLVQTYEGVLVLAHNPVGGNWGPRTPLVISISEDQGLSWKQMFILEKEEGEYSYPAIILANGKLYLTYTWNRKRIAFWELTVSSRC